MDETYKTSIITRPTTRPWLTRIPRNRLKSITLLTPPTSTLANSSTGSNSALAICRLWRWQTVVVQPLHNSQFFSVPRPWQGSKTKKGKGKGGSNVVKYPPRGKGKEFDPKGRAKASGILPTCFRCGQVGRMIYNCTIPKGGSSASKRKTAPTESSVGDVEDDHVIFTDNHGCERHECAMLVPGTNAFLPGHGPFLRYMLRLKETNYDITEVKLMRCKRAIYFGGDANLECTSTVQLPLCIGGKYGYVQMYLLPGETPMLLGKPIMESLGLVLDCRNRMIKLDDMPWQHAVVQSPSQFHSWKSRHPCLMI